MDIYKLANRFKMAQSSEFNDEEYPLLLRLKDQLLDELMDAVETFKGEQNKISTSNKDDDIKDYYRYGGVIQGLSIAEDIIKKIFEDV